MGIPILDLGAVLDYISDIDNRSHINARMVRDWQEDSFVEMEQLCEKLHHLFFLEAQLHCEEFHKAKKNFSRDGLTYGLISAYVRQHKGSNEYVFRRIYLKGRVDGQTESDFDRYPIPRGSRRGAYSKAAFKKYSSHDDELTLTLLTEAHFDRLRQMGTFFKSVLRHLRGKKMVSRTMDKKIGTRLDNDEVI